MILNLVNLVCVNIRGLANPAKLLEICEKSKTLDKNQQSCIFIQETKLTKMKEEHKRILEKYKLKSEEVPATGNSGGLLTLIPKNIDHQILMKSLSCLAVKIIRNNCEMVLVNTYINPKDFKARNFCASIQELNLNPSQNILVAGDLNAIDAEDIGKTKELCYPIKNNDIRVIRHKIIQSHLNSLLLKDMAKEQNESLPTHFDRRTKKFSRIDYVFSNYTNQNQKIEIVNFTSSDHKCLFLKNQEENTNNSPSYWKLNDSVLDDSNRINEILKTSISKLQNKRMLTETYDEFKASIRDDLRQLCIEKRNAENIVEKQLKNNLRQLELKLSESANSMELIAKIQQEIDRKNDELGVLLDKRNQQELKKIKNFFNEAFEGNPKHVKQLVSALRLSTRISKLEKDSGEKIQSQNDIVAELTSFYKKLYQYNAPGNRSTTGSSIQQKKYLEKYLKRIENRLATYDRTNINEDEILEYEVEKAILKLNKNSAPGPDGLTAGLFQNQIKLFVPLLTDLFNEILTKNRLPPSFTLAIIKLLPKKSNTIKKASDLRPISLINTDQKILSHVLANRIKPLFDTIIGQLQYAHLTERNIHTALTKIRQYSTCLKKNDSLCALDFTKAFDCVNRDFLNAILKQLPISETTIKLIEQVYKNTTSIIDINSEFSEPIIITKGVRQGCPLSALLFILVIEPLLEKIQRSKKLKTPNHQKIIAFADDITVSIKNNSINNLIKILDEFENVSGLAMNYEKSEVLTKNQKILFTNPEKN